MTLLRIIMQRETAHDAVEELGHLGMAQFNDLNAERNAFQRQFASEIKRCDELERKVRFFRAQCAKFRVQIPELKDPYAAIIKGVSGAPSGASIALQEKAGLDTLETVLEEHERDIKEINSRGDVLMTDYARVKEFQHVLERGRNFFSFAGLAGSEADVASEDTGLVESGFGIEMREATARAVQYVTGLIPRAKFGAFERIVFRATRGNSFVRYFELEQPVVDPTTNEPTKKNVFAVFFHGGRLHAKIVKLCESYGATLYPYPENTGDVATLTHQVSNRIQELDQVISQTNEQRRHILTKLSANLETWFFKITSEKAIFHNLNLFDFSSSDKTATAECWVPSKAVDDVAAAVQRAEHSSRAQVHSIVSPISSEHMTKPTHFELGEFTKSFQGIVEAYGVARYKEINPGLFTIATFPFLFAVMFGDAGHGILMTIFAALLILYERQIKAVKNLNEIVAMMFNGRYVLLLMGIFSIYVGIIYNDWFALSFDFFGSAYSFSDVVDSTNNKTITEGFQRPGAVYAFGVDPAWYATTNKLTFYNSLKMKLSILFGVTHMTAGIFCSLLNHLYHHDWLDVWSEFIPEILFMLCTFGYMCILVIVKWNMDWMGLNLEAPSLLETMTDFFLSPGTVKVQTFSNQGALQAALLLIAFAGVPVLLLGKPLTLKNRHKKGLDMHGRPLVSAHQRAEDLEASRALMSNGTVKTGGAGAGSSAAAHGEEEFVFGDIMVKQMIHTIEFVLGCISNTASYLRLWALSLAHAELSEVFMSMVLMLAIEADGVYGIMTYVGFAVWAGCTFAVLLLMESLSAFLHALRLHWVEFQNKFYSGDGIKFVPFSFKQVIHAASQAAATGEVTNVGATGDD